MKKHLLEIINIIASIAFVQTRHKICVDDDDAAVKLCEDIIAKIESIAANEIVRLAALLHTTRNWQLLGQVDD